MPEYEIALLVRGTFDDDDCAGCWGDWLAAVLENAEPEAVVDVRLSEVNP